jgi:hypothetical protein
MTIDQQLCDELTQAKQRHQAYVGDAIRVAGGQRVQPLPGSSAQAVVRFEVIHADPLCRKVLADTLVLVIARNPDIRFVAPAAAAADNYVSYWHREATEPGESAWAVLGGDQTSNTGEVYILGQTLPAQLATAGGAGYLAYNPNRPDDGWTVTVGVTGAAADELGELSFDVTVSARPDWTPETRPMLLQVKGE